jgi:hypothetical protein
MLEKRPKLRLLVSPREAAIALQISERTLWTYTAAGLIRCVRMPSNGAKGSKIAKRYEIAELQRFIDRHVAGMEQNPQEPQAPA